MAHSSPEQRDPVELPERSIELSRLHTHVHPMRHATSLFHEIHETIRRLLQHIVFVSLLVLRLYMLPLLYISYKLAERDDPWYPASWNVVLNPGRSLAGCVQCGKRDGSVTVTETWNSLRNGVFTPVRIFRSLYGLGKAITEEPHVLLHPSPIPILHAAPDSAIDVQSEYGGSVKNFENDSTDSSLEAPASASQIYHAALLNGSTLDDILAAFEADHKAKAIAKDALNICRTPKQSSHPEHEASAEKKKGHRYQSSSLQATPERMLWPRKTIEPSSPCRPVQTATEDIKEQRPQTPVRDVEKPRLKVMVEAGGENQVVSEVSKGGLGSPISCCEPKDPETQSQEKRPALATSKSTTTLRRCPTFVRRHTQPQTRRPVPRRTTSADKSSLTVLQDRGTMSTPALPLGSPTKRARLQRKIRVYPDQANPADE